MFAVHMPSRFIVACVVTALAIAAFAPSAAAATEQRSLDHAHKTLKTEQMGKNILSFGAHYRRHKYVATRAVVDAAGKKVAERFALVYRSEWDDDGTTDVAFLCDWRGNVYQIKIVETNAIIQQRFAVADLTIQAVGGTIMGAFGDDMTPEDKAELRRLIDAADSRGLLLKYVKLCQSLS